MEGELEKDLTSFGKGFTVIEQVHNCWLLVICCSQYVSLEHSVAISGCRGCVLLHLTGALTTADNCACVHVKSLEAAHCILAAIQNIFSAAHTQCD